MNKKGFQLSISMLVVVILGLALLGIGFSIFFSAYNQTVDIKERVDSQTAQQLNNLLDTGEAVVIPINSKEADRGDFVDFDLGISNELGRRNLFYLFVRFDSYSGRGSGDLTSEDLTDDLQARDISEGRSCSTESTDRRICADNWVLIPKELDYGSETLETDNFYLNANERHTVPIRIDLPRRMQSGSDDFGLPTGQYIFNIDIFYQGEDGTLGQCNIDIQGHCPRYFSRKKIYVRVQ